jgi:hypothetical protein
MAPLPEIAGIPPILVAQAGSATVPRPSGIPKPTTRGVTPPAAPTIAAPASNDWLGQARALAKRLIVAADRDAVRADVALLTEDQRKEIEKALPTLVASDSTLTAQAYRLRRIIRFVRHAPAAARRPPGSSSTLTGGVEVPGKQGRSATRAPTVASGTVTFKTGVDIHSGQPASGGYSLAYAGAPGSADDLRWLQFIWRMVDVDLVGTSARLTSSPLRLRTDTKAGKPFVLTTDLLHVRWVVDSTVWAKSAFYEEATQRTADKLTLFDAPSTILGGDKATNLFANRRTSSGEVLDHPPKRAIEHFAAATYLIQGMNVLYRADIHLTWEFTGVTPADPALASGDPPTWGIVDELAPAHRAALARHYPEVDYLPGDLMPAPELPDDFDPIPELNDAGWAGTMTPLARVSQVADLVNARLAPCVTGTGETSIRSLSNDVKSGDGAALPEGQRLLPGLNWVPKLPADGQCGYLDGPTYRNPDMPAERTSPLPDVAIKIGGSAIQLGSVIRPKTALVATMRHEMLHATHDELAIRWLASWQDELTTLTFDQWLVGKRTTGRPSKAERSYVATGVTKNKIATEILAYTEGLVATLPFLPPVIVFDSHLLKEELWPGAVLSLHGLRDVYPHRDGPETDKTAMEDAVRDRLRTAICVLTGAQRAAVRTWADYLLHVTMRSYQMIAAPTADQVTMITTLASDFGLVDDYVTTLLEVEKACPAAA